MRAFFAITCVATWLLRVLKLLTVNKGSKPIRARSGSKVLSCYGLKSFLGTAPFPKPSEATMKAFAHWNPCQESWNTLSRSFEILPSNELFLICGAARNLGLLVFGEADARSFLSPEPLKLLMPHFSHCCLSFLIIVVASFLFCLQFSKIGSQSVAFHPIHWCFKNLSSRRFIVFFPAGSARSALWMHSGTVITIIIMVWLIALWNHQNFFDLIDFPVTLAPHRVRKAASTIGTVVARAIAPEDNGFILENGGSRVV